MPAIDREPRGRLGGENSHSHLGQAERQQREARKKRIEYSHGLTTDTRREAEKFLKHCRGLDPSTLSPDKFDSMMDAVCDALTVLMEEEITHVHG